MSVEWVIIFFIGVAGSFVGNLVGGGGVITLPAMLIFNIPVQTGIGTNKFSFAVGTFSNVISIVRSGKIHAKIMLSLFIMGILGGITGGLITSNLNERVLNILVVILLIFALFITILKKPIPDNTQEVGIENETILQKFYSYLIGFYDGGFGPGSSTLAIIMFMHRGTHYVHSVYMARVLIFGSNIGSLLIYSNSGFINWYYAIPLTFGSIVGAQIGFWLLPKIPLHIARTIIMVITVLLIIQIMVKFF